MTDINPSTYSLVSLSPSAQSTTFPTYSMPIDPCSKNKSTHPESQQPNSLFTHLHLAHPLPQLPFHIHHHKHANVLSGSNLDTIVSLALLSHAPSRIDRRFKSTPRNTPTLTRSYLSPASPKPRISALSQSCALEAPCERRRAWLRRSVE